MSSDQTFVDRIIRDAYATIGKPESVISLLEQGEQHFDAGREDIGSVDQHFVEAGALIDEVSPLTGSDFANFELPDVAPSGAELVLDSRLCVVAFDEASFGSSEMAIGAVAPEWLWDPVERTEDLRRIREAERGSSLGFLRLFSSPDDEQGRWFNVEIDSDSAERHIHFKLIQFRWQEASGERFREALNLTDTELALTRHLVSGGNVRSFAELRDRSVGTARNQLKTLLRKLAINSQQELLMLYTGFAHSLRMIDEDSGPKRHFCSRIFNEGDGQRIAWEQHGDPDGLPVLYFHPFFEGALFTEEQDAAAREMGLRVIAPWRPLSGETTGRGKRIELVREFARRLDPFLEAQGVERCAVLGATAGTPFALAFAQRTKVQISGVVLAGPLVPLPTWADIGMVDMGYRRAVQMTRLAPAFARIYIRATLAGSLRGEFDKFIDDFYSSRPLDRAHYRRPEIRELIRQSGTYTFVKTLDGPTEGVIIEAFDWSELCSDIEAAVTLAVGHEGGFVSIENYEKFAGKHGFDLDAEFHRSGQLVMHDDPRRIFGTLRHYLNG